MTAPRRILDCTVKEAWWRAFETPYDGFHVFEPLEKSKWCKCGKCLVGYAAETPRKFFCAVDGFTDDNYARSVHKHHDQIMALKHQRECQHLFATSGMVPDIALELTQQPEFANLIPSLFYRISQCLMSQHFQVAERALFLWNNETVVVRITENRCVEKNMARLP